MRKLLLIGLYCFLQVSVYAQENWGPAQSITSEAWFDYCTDGMYGFSYPAISSNDSVMFMVYDCVDTIGVAFSIYEDGEWQIPENFRSEIYMDYPMPLFFYDRGDTVLYFASRMQGGYGGEDIWAIQFENGVWADPFNIGPPINSASNESSPSLPDDDSKLYFRRDGIIMSSDKINGQYSDPIPLPPTINSDLTELYPRISRDGLRLYFNRYGIFYLPDTLMVSYYSGGEWQDPIPLNDYINCNHQSPWCPMMPCISFGPSFSNEDTKMYFTHACVYGQFCEPGYDILVSDLITGIETIPVSPPTTFSLSAYPNPFNGSTNISISGDLESLSEIAIYDITGRRVRSFLPAGQVTWDGIDVRGTPVSSGIYFVRAASDNSNQSLKITYLR